MQEQGPGTRYAGALSLHQLARPVCVTKGLQPGIVAVASAAGQSARTQIAAAGKPQRGRGKIESAVCLP